MCSTPVSTPGWMRSGNRAVLTAAGAGAGVDSGVVRRTGGAHSGGGGADAARARSLTYRELDEASNRLAHLLAGHGCGPGTVCGAAVRRARPRRSWRCWRCSRPGRPICRSTRRCPTARIEFMLADAAPIAAVTTAGLRDAAGRVRPDGHRCRRPRCRRPTRHRVAGAGARRHRLHHLHLGHHRCAQGRGGHPPQRHPAAGVAGRRTCRARAGVDAVSFLWPSTSRCGRSWAALLRRRAAGGGARGGGRLTGGLPRLAGRANRSTC